MTDWQRNRPWHDASWNHGPWCRDSRRDRSFRDGSPCKESKACKCYNNDKSVIQLKDKVKHLERELNWLHEQITKKRHEDLQHDESTYNRSQKEESKPVKHTCYKNDQLIMQLKSKVEYLERKVDWLHQQIKEKRHEELKQQKILEYERRRAETMKYKSEQALSFDSQSENNSKLSSHDQYTEKKWKLETMDSKSTNSSDIMIKKPDVIFKKPDAMFKKSNGCTNKALPPSKNSEYRPISTTGVPGINVDIRRNIPAQESATKIRAISEYNLNLTPGT